MSKKSVLQLAFGEMGDPVLCSLIDDDRFDVPAIVTPPEHTDLYRKADRLPQEIRAEAEGIEIVKTDSLAQLHALTEKLAPDLVLIATFNKIIPEATLKLSKFVNIHHGKLPRQRGRANVNWAIINGEPSVSVSVHEAVPELDAGDILRQIHFDIEADDDIASLYGKINQSLTEELPDLLVEYLSGDLTLQPQDHSRASYYCTRLPRDGMIDWRWPRQRIKDLVRALRKPFPGAFTYLGDEKLIVWDVGDPPRERYFEGIVPGRVVGIHKGMGVEVLTGDGPLLLTQVESGGVTGDPSQLIKSSKTTLGLSVDDLLAKLKVLETAR